MWTLTNIIIAKYTNQLKNLCILKTNGFFEKAFYKMLYIGNRHSEFFLRKVATAESPISENKKFQRTRKYTKSFRFQCSKIYHQIQYSKSYIKARSINCFPSLIESLSGVHWNRFLASSYYVSTFSKVGSQVLKLYGSLGLLKHIWQKFCLKIYFSKKNCFKKLI